MIAIGWQAAPPDPTLVEKHIQLWQVSLEPGNPDLPELMHYLSPDEQERAARYRSLEAANRFIVARGLLRVILARYLKQDPASLVFDYNPNRKPFLPATSAISFNLSHSQNLAMLAITPGSPVGVDLEFLRREVETGLLLRRFFSEQEAEELEQVPARDKTGKFLAYWSLKEAYVKFRGLTVGHLSEEIGLISHLAELWNNNPVWLEQENCTFWSLSPHPDYCGGLAVEGQGWYLDCFTY